MSRYRMDNGTVVDTDNATQSWDEETDWDGNNHISRATDTQWDHQRLHRSKRGRYYVEHTSQWQGSRPHVEWVSNEEACRWLLHMEHDIPEEIAHLIEEVSE